MAEQFWIICRWKKIIYRIREVSLHFCAQTINVYYQKLKSLSSSVSTCALNAFWRYARWRLQCDCSTERGVYSRYKHVELLLSGADDVTIAVSTWMSGSCRVYAMTSRITWCTSTERRYKHALSRCRHCTVCMPSVKQISRSWRVGFVTDMQTDRRDRDIADNVIQHRDVLYKNRLSKLR